MQLEIHYSVDNCGDGSAYPIFCESKLVAEVHQDILVNGYEGWGEQCIGSITVETEDPGTIWVTDEIMTKEKLIKELKEYINEFDEDRPIYRIKDLLEGIERLL